VLKLLKQNKFQDYWFETATPAFLVNLIKEQQYPVPFIETLELSQPDFTVYDLDDLCRRAEVQSIGRASHCADQSKKVF
jgi:hypothetical protein